MPVKTLRAISGGKERIVGLWRHPEDGKFAEAFRFAREARNHVEGLQIAHMNINGNDRLSTTAKAEDRYKASKERLQFIGQLQRGIDTLRSQNLERASRLAAVPPYRDSDAVSVQIDLALAAQLRAMEPAARNAALIAGTHQVFVNAALRLPRELTGISADWHARILKEAIARAHPREAQEVEDMTQAIEDAQEAVRVAFDIIQSDSGMSLVDKVEAAGDSAAALVTGVSPGTVERISERLAAQAKAEDDAADEEEQRLRAQIGGQA
ncbi:hypothetical protein [Pseudomonas sp. NBRC 111136]|uniref:hypothetical protein n=1 Tax=Pseudomonas sp. NBRC 111136 TaxID=1661051 RepID=UPI000761B846|nr:hypothetical protein [Pseudomonas sp. NBRC 111136]